MRVKTRVFVPPFKPRLYRPRFAQVRPRWGERGEFFPEGSFYEEKNSTLIYRLACSFRVYI